LLEPAGTVATSGCAAVAGCAVRCAAFTEIARITLHNHVE